MKLTFGDLLVVEDEAQNKDLIVKFVEHRKEGLVCVDYGREKTVVSYANIIGKPPRDIIDDIEMNYMEGNLYGEMAR